MTVSGASDPATPGPPGLVETHSALIILWGDEAHKLRKPLDLGFLDNTTVEARAEQSRREVELNGRLAPDVYTGVLEVRGPDGEVIDHVVRMRRLPAHLSLAALVRSRQEGSTGGGDTDIVAGIREVARQIDHLHAASPRSDEIDAAGSPAAVARLWAESLDHLCGLDVGRDAPEIVDDIADLASGYLRGRAPLLRSRLAAGRIVDGHGDLLAADVYLTDDGPRVIDCLEFDDRLRFGDAMLDVGFLAMDLDAAGARDLAVVLLEAYRDFSGDDAPPSLVHHYIAYRALVRSKVTAIRAEQVGDGVAGGEARRALELADRAVDSLLRGRVRLVLVGGVSGSGKSTLAAPLAEALSADLLRSDVVRGEIAGAAADRYSDSAIDAVYTEMLARAAGLLAQGRTVVLDATWLEPRRRAEAETVAVDAHAELVEIACIAPRDELVRRITARATAGADPSEATVEVLDFQLVATPPWLDAIEVDTVGLDARDRSAVHRWAERELGPLPWA
ncbi:AAA family ATPase [Dietzia sp. SL131]|uniref:bifunctional aminoglycoside phosphotransferase/ATP-binding protein n=1 Tax=Dietzia sp. SL131 TaxID=2995149 RepID=UPI00227CB00B|nr:bifunctional aminoglycoside phosphotransferase/ATP-binding protein [Dietzia sp. SL131]MCY1659029.1 AAA family ATPase [Dietzia sp. SL131]